MVSNYQRGYQTEWRAKQELEKLGFFVTRAAGSHTLFDLWCVNKSGMRLIQLKRVKKGNGYFKNEIQEILEFHNHPENCSKELWIWYDWKKRGEKWERIVVS